MTTTCPYCGKAFRRVEGEDGLRAHKRRHQRDETIRHPRRTPKTRDETARVLAIEGADDPLALCVRCGWPMSAQEWRAGFRWHDMCEGIPTP